MSGAAPWHTCIRRCGGPRRGPHRSPGGAAQGCPCLPRILAMKESKKGSGRPLAKVLEMGRARPSPEHLFPNLVPSPATLRSRSNLQTPTGGGGAQLRLEPRVPSSGSLNRSPPSLLPWTTGQHPTPLPNSVCEGLSLLRKPSALCDIGPYLRVHTARARRREGAGSHCQLRRPPNREDAEKDKNHGDLREGTTAARLVPPSRGVFQRPRPLCRQ